MIPVDQNDPVIGIQRQATNNSVSSFPSQDDASLWSSGGRETAVIENSIRLHERSSGSRLALFSKSDIPYAPGVGDSNEGKCWDRQVVLSLDGGGIRGLSELFILEVIMQQVVKIEKSLGDTQSSADIPRPTPTSSVDSLPDSDKDPSIEEFLPCHYFDYICGTSLGGVIATLLGRLRCSVPEAIQYYGQIGNAMATNIPAVDRVIPGTKSREDCSLGMDQALEAILKDQREKRRTRSWKGNADGIQEFRTECSLCKTLVLAVQYDSKTHIRRPYLFRTYPFTKSTRTSTLNRFSKDSFCDSVSIKDVCLATSASQDYFRGHRIGSTKFRDGSKWMSNPSMELFREVDSIHADIDTPLYCFVSIGSGRQAKGFAEKTLGPFLHHGILRRKAVHDREQNLVHQVLINRSDEGRNFAYFRFDGPENIVDIRPSEWKAGNRQKLNDQIRLATHTYCQRNIAVQKSIERLAQKLVDYRRKRASTSHWEKYVAMPKTETTRHSCTWCNDCQDEDRDRFIEHVKGMHHAKISGDDRYFGQYRAILQNSQIPSIVALSL